MKRVAILQHRLLHYREAFFDQLRLQCYEKGFQLDLVHGQPTKQESKKNDTGSLDWAIKVKNYTIEVGGRDLIWQALPRNLRNVDLIIIMQESRLISNYPILLSKTWSTRKVAYWGHGANFQSNAPNGVREKWKTLLATHVDWWFAYTEITEDIVKKSGFPSNRITRLNNSIDTTQFQRELAEIEPADIEREKHELGITHGAMVGVFCGSLYPEKKLDFLIASCDEVRKAQPDFHCVIIGDGPSMPYLHEAARHRTWIHLLGSAKGARKALYFRMATFMLNPGAVGLHVVDAFCAGLIMVTTNNAKHGPEICYLEDNINGLITDDNPTDYSQRILEILKSRYAIDRIRESALAAAKKYSLDNMVAQFTTGIESCLTSA